MQKANVVLSLRVFIVFSVQIQHNCCCYSLFDSSDKLFPRTFVVGVHVQCAMRKHSECDWLQRLLFNLEEGMTLIQIQIQQSTVRYSSLSANSVCILTNPNLCLARKEKNRKYGN